MKKWLNSLVLYGVALVFLGLSAISLNEYFHNAQIISSHIQLSAWSLAQLELEQQKFFNNLRLFQAGAISHKELMFSYDMLWNRLTIFLEGDENRDIRSRFHAEKTVGEFFDLLRKLEPTMLHLKQNSEPISQLVQDVAGYQSRIRELMVLNFTGPEASKQLDGIRQSQRILAFNISGLVLSGCLLVFYLLRQSRRYNQLALSDPLTGLANRSAFQQQLNLTFSRRQRGLSALCLIDLNNFREVNLTLGQAQGDDMLKRVAQRIRAHLRQQDMVARLDSDDFAIILRDLDSREEGLGLMRYLQRVLVFEYLAQEKVFQVDVGIGVAFMHDVVSDDDIMLEASLALSEAKRSKEHAVALFEPWMSEQEHRRRELLQSLRRLLEGRVVDGALRLVYQPVYRLSDQAMLGAEALIRWAHPHYGNIPPPELIELAENNGLGRALGEWLFSRLQFDRDVNRVTWPDGMTVALNLSPSLFHAGLPEWVAGQLQRTGFRAEQLVLEITENITMVDFQRSKQILEALKQMGIKVALDDFGTGYSSLSYLRELKVDKLKIDRSFVHNLHEDQNQRMFVMSIVQLAHHLQVQVVAEGIECRPEELLATELGCDEGQGYLYARPLEASHLPGMWLVSNPKQALH